MRPILTLIFTTLLLASCDLTEVGGTQSSREDIWKNPTFSKDSTSRERVRCFITGLDYPDGYDWRADPEKGVVKCSLVVFCDGIPVMKVPVGKEYEVSPDPDMHRIIDGDLYTDYSTSDETVIKKNGKELFRYGGREMILGMTVSKGSIYTLGQPRHGEGFTYRKEAGFRVSKAAIRSGFHIICLQRTDLLPGRQYRKVLSCHERQDRSGRDT